MKYLATVLIFGLLLCTVGCDPVEKQAYKTIVAAKAFLDSEKAAHPECPSAGTAVCDSIMRAVAAKDFLIDTVEVYCSSPQFENGGACQPPAKGTPAADQAKAKLEAALSTYDQAAADLKKAVK